MQFRRSVGLEKGNAIVDVSVVPLTCATLSTTLVRPRLSLGPNPTQAGKAFAGQAVSFTRTAPASLAVCDLAVLTLEPRSC